MTSNIPLRTGLHQFPGGTFGSTNDLIHSPTARERDTLLIACSGQGAAPDNISFAKPDRFVILQHIGASIPSKAECETHDGLSMDDVETLFDQHDFRNVIVCGHLGCRVIRNWIQPQPSGYKDIGAFRLRFEKGSRDLVDSHYSTENDTERWEQLVCEHVLCQIENMLTHAFVMQRGLAQKTSFHAWVIDDETARVSGYNHEKSAFALI